MVFHGDFPFSPVVKTLLSNAGGLSSVPSQGAKIHMPCDQKKKTEQKQDCDKFNKDFKKKDPHQKNY